MPRIVPVILALHVLFLIVAVISFINAHGGLHGNIDRSVLGLDPHSRDADFVLFNRWDRGYDTKKDPLVHRVFLILNSPSYIAGAAIFGVLNSVVSEFQDPFPFGISHPSYTYTFMLLISPFQWYGIARLIELLRRRPSV
jgi:hypothetical protein